MAILLIGGSIPNGVKKLIDFIKEANLIAAKEENNVLKWTKRNELITKEINTYFCYWVNDVNKVPSTILKLFSDMYYNKKLVEYSNDEYFLIE